MLTAAASPRELKCKASLPSQAIHGPDNQEQPLARTNWPAKERNLPNPCQRKHCFRIEIINQYNCFSMAQSGYAVLTAAASPRELKCKASLPSHAIHAPENQHQPLARPNWPAKDRTLTNPYCFRTKTTNKYNCFSMAQSGYAVLTAAASPRELKCKASLPSQAIHAPDNQEQPLPSPNWPAKDRTLTNPYCFRTKTTNKYNCFSMAQSGYAVLTAAASPRELKCKASLPSQAIHAPDNQQQPLARPNWPAKDRTLTNPYCFRTKTTNKYNRFSMAQSGYAVLTAAASPRELKCKASLPSQATHAGDRAKIALPIHGRRGNRACCKSRHPRMAESGLALLTEHHQERYSAQHPTSAKNPAANTNSWTPLQGNDFDYKGTRMD